MRIKTKLREDKHLNSTEAIAAYISAAMHKGDPQLITAAIGEVARAKGMTQVARDTGLAREHLYVALCGDSRPGFDTVLRVLRALGVRLDAHPIEPMRRANKKRRRAP